MNRFEKGRRRPVLLNNLLTVPAFCLMLALLWEGLQAVSGTASREEADSLRSSIVRGAVQCYATEGFYPEDLDYLEEHYGIAFDPDKYAVYYEASGANLMPDIAVLPLRKEGQP